MKIIDDYSTQSGIVQSNTSNNITPSPLELQEKFIELEEQRIENVCNVISTGFNAARDIAGFYADCKKINAQTEQLRMMTDIQMQSIAAKYELTRQFLCSTFQERGTALSKHYDVLDTAVLSGDREMIVNALKNISDIVTSSPLSDLEKFADMFNNNSPSNPLIFDF